MAKIDKLLDKFNKVKSAVNSLKGISSKIQGINYTSAIDSLGDDAEFARSLLVSRQKSLKQSLKTARAKNHVKQTPETMGNMLIYPKSETLANYITFDIAPRQYRDNSTSVQKAGTFSAGVSKIKGREGEILTTEQIDKSNAEDWDYEDRPYDSVYSRRSISLYIPDTVISQASVGYRAENISGTMRELAKVFGSVGSGDFFKQSGESIGKIADKFILETINKMSGGLTNLRAGRAVNPMQEQLLDSVPFRSWDFTFDFYPKSKREALEVREIIRVFRESMLPDTYSESKFFNRDNASEISGPQKADTASYFNYPNIFQIYFSGPIANKIDGFLPAVCTNAQVDYTGGQKFSTFYDGMPSHIQLTLNFAEIKVMTLGNYDMIKASAVGDSTFGSTDSLSGDSIAFERNNAAVNPDNRNITDQTLAQKIKKGTT